MKRILIISRGTVGTYMSSPGIRAYYMAQVLAKNVPDAEVTLAVPNVNDQPEALPGVRIATYGPLKVMPLIAANDIIISSGFSPQHALQFPDKLFVADLFSQYYMEWMELSREDLRGLKRSVWMNKNRAYLAMQLTLADFVLCANERQRDTYVGMMSALGLIDPDVYDRDDSLRRVIDIAPHGIRAEPPERGEPILKGVYGGIKETDKVIVWNGGTVSWYDPDSFLRALHLLSKERDDIKTLFLGTFYPGLDVSLGYGPRFKSAYQLSKDLELHQRSVFFEFGWLPHKDVARYLMESDLGVCTYFDNLETRYSHRTRFLDLFWAELPIICTHGDVLAADIDERGMGIVVPEGNVEAIAVAITKLVDDKEFLLKCQENIREYNKTISWETTLDPLVRFCREGTSVAVTKRDRFLPFIGRTTEYLLTRLQDAIVPKR